METIFFGLLRVTLVLTLSDLFPAGMLSRRIGFVILCCAVGSLPPLSSGRPDLCAMLVNEIVVACCIAAPVALILIAVEALIDLVEVARGHSAQTSLNPLTQGFGSPMSVAGALAIRGWLVGGGALLMIGNTLRTSFDRFPSGASYNSFDRDLLARMLGLIGEVWWAFGGVALVLTAPLAALEIALIFLARVLPQLQLPVEGCLLRTAFVSTLLLFLAAQLTGPLVLLDFIGRAQNMLIGF